MGELIVTSRHCRAAGMCIVPGVKEFCKRHDIDFRAFVREGIDSNVLIATGDAMALHVVDVARKEQEVVHGR